MFFFVLFGKCFKLHLIICKNEQVYVCIAFQNLPQKSLPWSHGEQISSDIFTRMNLVSFGVAASAVGMGVGAGVGVLVLVVVIVVVVTIVIVVVV